MTDVLTYKLVADLLKVAGYAMVKLTDGFKHMVITGNAGFEYLKAKKIYNHLIDLSAHATTLRAINQISVVNNIDDYLGIDSPTLADWNVVVAGVADIIIRIGKLLEDIGKERNDFVREDAYTKLIESLASRANILQQLARMKPPQSAEEKVLLRKINEEYKRLLNNFQDAIKELNLYLKQLKPI